MAPDNDNELVVYDLLSKKVGKLGVNENKKALRFTLSIIRFDEI